jgi:hypothetical protein
MSKNKIIESPYSSNWSTRNEIIKLKKYKLSPEDQSLLNLKYIDFTSNNPDLLNFLRLKPCLMRDLNWEIREYKIWDNFEESFYSELLKIASNWSYKDWNYVDYSFYSTRTDAHDPLEQCIYAFGDAIERFDINFIKKTFPKDNDLKQFIERMVGQGFLKSRQWHHSNNEKKQLKFIKTKLEELLLSLPLEGDYFDSYSKNFSELTYKIHTNNKDALIKYINAKDEIAVTDLKRMPSKILNLDLVMQTVHTNIAKQKNKSFYQDRMLKFFFYTKKNEFWDLEKIPEIFNLIKDHATIWSFNIQWDYFLKYTPHLKNFTAQCSKNFAFQNAYIDHFFNTSSNITNIPNEISDKYFDEKFWSIIHPKLINNSNTKELLDRSIKRGIITDILQLALSIKNATEHRDTKCHQDDLN